MCYENRAAFKSAAGDLVMHASYIPEGDIKFLHFFLSMLVRLPS